MGGLPRYYYDPMTEVPGDIQWKLPDRPRWCGPPDDEMPGSVGVDLRLGASGSVVVYLSRPASYIDGLRFDVTAVKRGGDALNPSDFLRLPDIRRMSSDGVPSDFLHLGVEFADGRCTSNLVGHDDVERAIDDPPEIVLCLRGGESHVSKYSYCRYDWYLWPLPARGDLVFVCEWPAFGIEETRTVMDGDKVRAAALCACGLWD